MNTLKEFIEYIGGFVFPIFLIGLSYVWAFPLIVYRGKKKQNQGTDAIFRSAAAIAVGVVGFWLPQAIDCYYRYPDSLDRIGFMYLWSLPIIVVYAILATISLVRGCRGVLASSHWGRLALVLSLAMLCWSPIAYEGFVMIWNERAFKAYKEHPDSWPVSYLNSKKLDHLPPQLSILPTKFPPSQSSWQTADHGLKWGGISVDVSYIVWEAYTWSPGRTLFPAGKPHQRYDAISTLPQGSKKALQRELKDKLGFIGRREMRDMDVLVLKVRNPKASGLKPPIAGDPDADDRCSAGYYYCDDQPLSTFDSPNNVGLATALEYYFQMPVIDETGLTNHFHIELKWYYGGEGDPGHHILKKALLKQLGLELVPARRPIEMLVMEKGS